MDKFFQFIPFIFDRIFPSSQPNTNDTAKQIQPYDFPFTIRCNNYFSKVREFFFAVSYSSLSYCRQHIKRPHKPEIFVGFKDKLWSFAILIDTGTKSPKKEEQHNGRPHGPIPPIIFASSRTPICRSSIRVRNTAARSFTNSLKSIRPSAVKRKNQFVSIKCIFSFDYFHFQLTQLHFFFCDLQCITRIFFIFFVFF